MECHSLDTLLPGSAECCFTAGWGQPALLISYRLTTQYCKRLQCRLRLQQRTNIAVFVGRLHVLTPVRHAAAVNAIGERANLALAGVHEGAPATEILVPVPVQVVVHVREIVAGRHGQDHDQVAVQAITIHVRVIVDHGQDHDHVAVQAMPVHVRAHVAVTMIEDAAQAQCQQALQTDMDPVREAAAVVSHTPE